MNGPILGSTFTAAIGDPTGATGLSTPTPTLWFVGTAPELSTYPCGLLLPGWGIGTAAGEIMIDLGQPHITLVGPSMQGATNPALYSIPIPNLSALAMQTLFTQGVILGGSGTPLILTDGLDLTLGQ